MKKLLSFLLCLILFCGCIPNGVTINAYATTDAQIKPLSEREVSYRVNTYLSTPNLQNLKQQFYTAAVACSNDSIDVSDYGFKGQDIQEIFELITECKDEYPELYHISGARIKGKDTNNNQKIDLYEEVTGIIPTYYFDANTYKKYNDGYKKAAAKMIADLKDSSISDLEKLLILHDRIVVFCEYDFKNYELYQKAVANNPYSVLEDYIPPESFTMYGALVKGVAVCEGYSKAYQYMLNQLGIENYLCSSQSLNHVWNIVKLNGKYYHVDVTFDDPQSKGEGDGENYIGTDRTGRVSHKYFLRSTNGMKTAGNHKANDFDTTPNDTTYDNYFWQESETAFSLLNGEIYYINNAQEKLMRWAGGNGKNDTYLHSVEDSWRYSGNYACLSADNGHLYYNTSDTVYEYNVKKDTVLKIHTPKKDNGKDIYGFKVYDNIAYCDIASSPYYFAGQVLLDKYGPIKIIDINVASISNIVDKTYTGGKITQSPNITYGGKVLKLNTDYKLAFSNNIATGRAKVVISGIGSFAGSVTKYFYIRPKKVEKLKVKKATASSITISWSKAPSGTGYTVLRATSKKGTYKTVATINSRSTVSYTNKKLSKNKTYYYKVVAFKTVSGKKYTSVASSTLTAKTATSAPKISYYKNTSSKAAKLKWKKVSGATRYQVYMKSGKKGKYKKIYSGTKLTYTAKKLKKGKTYYFKVRTYKKSGSVNAYSSYSSVKKVKIKK